MCNALGYIQDGIHAECIERNTQTNREGTPEATNRRDRGLTVKKPGTGLTARSGGLTVRTIKAASVSECRAGMLCVKVHKPSLALLCFF